MQNSLVQLYRNLKVVLESLESELFGKGDTKVYLAGVCFTRNDWKNMIFAIDKIIKDCEKSIKCGSKYLKEHKEYNRKTRLLCYYKGKKFKTKQDFYKIEELERDLVKIKQKIKSQKERKLAKVPKAVINQILKEDYLVRGIEDENKDE